MRKCVRFVVFVSIMFAPALACVGSRGVVHVGQPQVHIRERLIPERQSRSEWLRKELRDNEKNETTFQGLRDLRSFEGVFASLRASIDPAKGDLAEIENENEELRREAEQWQLKKAVFEAKHDYEEATSPNLGGTTGTGDTPLPAPAPATQIAAPPAATAPFGSDRELIKASDAETTRAQVHPLERFRDKLAVRDAIESELRQSQFDDAHDVMGGTLYELTLDLALAPGDWSKEFAQVDLQMVQPEPDSRARELEPYYYLWLSKLGSEIQEDIEGMLAGLAPGAQSRCENIEWLRWYIATRIAPTVATIEEGFEPLTEAWRALESHPQFLWNTLQPPLVAMASVEIDTRRPRIFEATQNPAWLSQRTTPYGLDFSRRLDELRLLPGGANYATTHLDAVLADASQSRELVAICVAHAYQLALGGIVTLDVQDASVVTRPPPRELEDHAYLGFAEESKRPPFPGEAAFRGKKGGESASQTIVDGYQLLGVKEFVRRLLRAEQMTVQVYAIQPKELAQNVSDVSARESIVDMVLAVQAMLASKGVSAEGQFQYLEKVQERLHAVLRQPLVVGFSRGRTEDVSPAFGWVIGPKFAIRDGEAVFRHSPARYDVSAEVVVPAWVDRLRLKGSYHWIHSRGGSAAPADLWNGEEVTVSLPRPDELYAHLNRALLDERTLDRDGDFLALERRPVPRITKETQAKTILAGPKRTLLVLGEDVWRNPQVFLGHQQADRVEVLSSMKGVIAHFDELEYPGKPPADPKSDAGIGVRLTLVTSYGQDAMDGITILPAPAKVVVNDPSAVLTTRFLVAPETLTLEFVYPRPAAFHHVVARLVDGSSSAEFAPTRWEGDKLGFQCPPDKWPPGAGARVVNVELLRFDRDDQKVGARLTAEKTPLALFPNEKSRALAATGSGGEITIAFDKTGKIKNPESLRFTFDESLRAPMLWAYPELLVASPSSPALFVDKLPAELRVNILPPIGNRIVLEVAGEKLRSAVEPILGKAAAETRIVVHSSDGKKTEVPIFVEEAKAKLRFTQEDSSAKFTVIGNADLYFQGITKTGADEKPKDAFLHLSGTPSELELLLGDPDWSKKLYVFYPPAFTLENELVMERELADAIVFRLAVPPHQVVELMTHGPHAFEVWLGKNRAKKVPVDPAARLQPHQDTEAGFTLRTESLQRREKEAVEVIFEVPRDELSNLKASIEASAVDLTLSVGTFNFGFTAKAIPVKGPGGEAARLVFKIEPGDKLWTDGWKDFDQTKRNFNLRLGVGAEKLKCNKDVIELVKPASK
jgi:hypothetical protein